MTSHSLASPIATSPCLTPIAYTASLYLGFSTQGETLRKRHNMD